MKIRDGFVSNSSSSSFIVGVPEGKLPSTAEFIKLFGAEPGTIAAGLVKPFAEAFSGASKWILDEFLDNYGVESVEEFKAENHGWTPECLKLYEKGWSIYELSVANDDGDAISGALYEMGGLPSGDIRTDSLVVVYEG